MSGSDYRKAYEAAKKDLEEVIRQQEALEAKKVRLRKTIEALAEQCEAEAIEIQRSPDAAYLLETTKLADEIRAVLMAVEWIRPSQIKDELEKLGHDLSKYGNPQAAIQMVLKRMVESDEVLEKTDEQGKKVYRKPGHVERTVLARYRQGLGDNTAALDAFTMRHYSPPYRRGTPNAKKDDKE